jgi:hypothetical protein
MQEPPDEDTAVPRPVGAPILAQQAPSWLLTAGLAVLAAAVAVLLLISVPAGL